MDDPRRNVCCARKQDAGGRRPVRPATRPLHSHHAVRDGVDGGVHLLRPDEDVEAQGAVGGVDEREEDEGADALVLAVGDGDAEEEEDAGEDEVHGRDDGGEDFYRGHRADDGAPAAAVLEEVHARRDDAEDVEGEGDEYQPGRQRDHDDAGRHVQDHDRAGIRGWQFLANFEAYEKNQSSVIFVRNDGHSPFSEVIPLFS